MSVTLGDFLTSDGWSTAYTCSIPERVARYENIDDLELSKPAKRFITSKYNGIIYTHQHDALRELAQGKNVCLTTSTASGKSLIFYAASIELLNRFPGHKVIAVFPLKALAREQQERWQEAVEVGGHRISVERIDGSVPTSTRLDVMARADVVIMTPDVMHAWLLRSLHEEVVAKFLARVCLVVLDECHTYTGVFGSNVAFLLRRLEHAISVLGGKAQFIGASATISDAAHYMEQLTGRPFVEIGADQDGSPHHELRVHMVNTPDDGSITQAMVGLIEFLLTEQRRKFIVFVDSRKQTEQLAAALYDTEGRDQFCSDPRVMPYRSGYEEQDRASIETALKTGGLAGVISTSALELGIDIGLLNTCVLVGVPHSSTSLYQRIGRVGRQTSGDVVIVNTGDFHSQTLFQHPDRLLNMPCTQTALYLENKQVQYIHAMCLARQEGEDAMARLHLGQQSEDFEVAPTDSWPSGFIDLCQKERSGEIPAALQSLKGIAGDDPNRAFPLRNCDTQLRITVGRDDDLGSITLSQALREAYPGAVYMYMAHTFQVVKVDVTGHRITVRPTSYHSTSPIEMPPLVLPNISAGSVYQSCKVGSVKAVECGLLVRESVHGVTTHYPFKNVSTEYPLTGEGGVYYPSAYFSRKYSTTGVLFTLGKSLPAAEVDLHQLAQLLLEAFLTTTPFERRDVHASSGIFLTTTHYAPKGSSFISIYDATFGSLHLSGRLLDSDILRKVGALLSSANAHALSKDSSADLNDATVEAARDLGAQLEVGPSRIDIRGTEKTSAPERYVPIILPGSRGVNPNKNNEEFIISSVCFIPGMNGLYYTGCHESETNVSAGTKIYLAVDHVEEIPGISRLGFYDLETGATLSHLDGQSSGSSQT